MDISRRHLLAAGLATAALPALATGTRAQANWPNKPIKIIVPYPVGGQTDLIARTYGDYIGKQLGQPVVVDNKTGGSGVVGLTEVKRAAPDGYTLLLTIGTPLINNVVLFKDLPYDPDKDFTVISSIAAQGVPLVVADKVPAKNLAEFVAYAKKEGKVSLGTYGANSAAHMAILEINKQYGLDIEPVHYRGEAPMWADVMSQSIDGGLGSYVAALPLLQANRARVIGASGRPIKVLPEVKTLKEQGATSKFFEIDVYSAILAAPAGTPMEIVKKLADLMVAGGKDAKTQAAFSSSPVELPLGFEETQIEYKKNATAMRTFIEGLGIPKQ
jgi:tripartite-type tricarboxylate transporter receptor subunit TctC